VALQDLQYGQPAGNFVADRIQPGSLGAVGYDDEGVKAREWDLVKTASWSITRPSATRPISSGEKGLARLLLLPTAGTTSKFQRMPNVSLKPGTKPQTPAEMIAGVERGIYSGRRLVLDRPAALQLPVRRRAVLRDQQGQDRRMLRDVAYSPIPRNLEFGVGICDKAGLPLGGSSSDGKGPAAPDQPPSPTGVHDAGQWRSKVINTARKIGLSAMTGLNEAQARELLAKAIKMSKAEAFEMNIGGNVGGNIRYRPQHRVHRGRHRGPQPGRAVVLTQTERGGHGQPVR